MSDTGRERGNRAEEVANWYFRLNGCFLLPGYVVHPDYEAPAPRTEADLIAVRMRHTSERIGGRRLYDDDIIRQAAKANGASRHLFALVEVKAGQCAINGPWSRPEAGNMRRAIARMGFANDGQAKAIADSLYRDLRWEGDEFVVQYFCVGKRSNRDLDGRGGVIQILFSDIASFLHGRFMAFPEKIPTCPAVELQWPGFGHDYAYWADARRHVRDFTPESSRRAVQHYIDTGSLE